MSKQRDSTTQQSNTPTSEQVINVHLHKHIGLVLDSTDVNNKQAKGHFITHSAIMGPTGTLHGGILYVVCDSISFLSLLPHLKSNESAATIDHSVSVVNAVIGLDQRVELVGQLVKRTKNLAFFESKVYNNGKLIAYGKTTKAIIKALPVTNLTKSKL